MIVGKGAPWKEDDSEQDKLSNGRGKATLSMGVAAVGGEVKIV